MGSTFLAIPVYPPDVVFQIMDFYAASGMSLLWICFFETVYKKLQEVAGNPRNHSDNFSDRGVVVLRRRPLRRQHRRDDGRAPALLLVPLLGRLRTHRHDRE